jgi:S-DNA-T family DNA segregation ATPase FtsK/SpoIIIE
MPKPLRAYLENQADRVEMVLSAQKAPGRVTGGTVGPRIVRFFLEPEPGVRYEKLRRLSADLAIALHVSSARIDRSEKGIILEFAHPNPRPVSLLKLLPQVVVDEHGNPDPLPDTTALLGLTDDGIPLLARLASPSVAPVLVAGMTGSGKSVLLRSAALSLLMTHEADKLRMICMAPDGKTFAPVEGAPHLLRPQITEPPAALEALRSLVHALKSRRQRGETHPYVVVMIDELGDLIYAGGDEITENLMRLIQYGQEVGIYLIVATQRPSSAIMAELTQAHFALRLIGKVVSASDARLASGRGGTDAHLLKGRGDFLAIGGGEAEPLRFQVAFAGEAEIRQAIAKRQNSTTPSAFLEPEPVIIDVEPARVRR